MRWKGGRSGGGIEDRRGMGAGGVAGGSLGVLVLAAIGYFVFGLDPATTTRLANEIGVGAPAAVEGQTGTPADEAGRFVDVIGANLNDVWIAALPGYTPPRVVLYDQATPTDCGFGQAAMGPFYCPPDRSVYLDVTFWAQLAELGGSDAEFARAYVIAHEYGHHVQTLTGTADQARQAQQAAGSTAEANRYSVALELQADCYAGVWAANAARASGGEVALEPGDLEAGLATAAAIGDDALQQRGGGRVSPESFTHGTSAERAAWLRRGYEAGHPSACNTFQNL
ncbi:MAG TPA: neutral zinc metallopeptidase [Brevundimonas sp.]|jgi:hypothetical protein|uniref:KPN_02809 family neutral zinc metallopeptidase n=1 Tax=Brevundimonas sp. TaxID=1871086 RepID=UPI002E0E4F92|nr:neutral zinc metallopeptidase [Brevundimonas sp.]